MADAPFRIRVEGLGRVAEADVTVRPLTLFVGENNSGKSWIATAIWAFHHGILPKPDETEPAWVAALAQATSLVERAAASGGAIEIDGDWAAFAEELSPSIGRPLLASAFRGEVHGTVRVACAAHVGTLEVADSQTFSMTSNRSKVLKSFDINGNAGQLAARLIGSSIVKNGGLTHFFDQSFGFPSLLVGMLPASRTGFMQMLPSLVDSLLSGRQDGFFGIPAPVLQFLRLMANPIPMGSAHEDLAALIEARALSGRVAREPDGVARYGFTPDGASAALPMGRASAVVTELAPLVMMLRVGCVPRLLIYEEPEALLHPRLQRVVAQVLVRLVRRGTKVLVTTHSTTFAQQLNSFIKLGALGLDAAGRDRMAHDLDQIAYTDEDHLLPDEVGAYGFRFRDDGRTVVDRLEVRDDGVVMPSFNLELRRMADEFRWLNERLDER
jgi:hypothetical protein